MKRNRTYLAIACMAFFALALCLSPTALLAQSTTQGSIAGTVLDQSQAVIPSAIVKIENTATGFSVQLVSDTSGFFKAPLLEPGNYRVSITAANFANYRAENVTVLVGQTTTIAPILSVASSSSEVVVTDQTPTINLESPDFAGTLSSQALQSIPINNRRWSSLAMSTPGVVSDSNGYGLVSVRGISTLLNNVEIDGADDNQAFFSEERGRTREAYSTSANAVREFAVNTGVYSAQYGRAAGGVITSVTKSGTNQIHGQAYFFDKQSNWAAYNNYTKLSSLVNGSVVSNTIKPKDLRKLYGFTAGGALIKDKLFWIYSYDQHSRVFPVVGVPYNSASFYTLPLSSGVACNLTPATPTAAGNGFVSNDAYIGSNAAQKTVDAEACTLAARQGITYAQAVQDWNALLLGGALHNGKTDLGLNSALGQVSRFGYQEINTPKIDWQINEKHHVSILYHRLRWDSPGGVQTAASDNYSRDAQGNDFVKLDYGVAKLTSLLSSNMSNEVLYQYGRELDYETQQPYTDYTLANFNDKSGNIPYVQIGASSSGWGLNAGSPYYSYRPAYPLEKKWQVGDIFYWNKGNHSIKFGADILHNYDFQNNLYEGNGAYSYQFIGPYFNDVMNLKNGVNPATNNTGCDSTSSQSASSSTAKAVAGFPCYQNFYQGFGAPSYSINTLDTGVFVQDNWKITPRLTLELGVRYDHETMPFPDQALLAPTGNFTALAAQSNHPSHKFDFGPRVGFSYDVFGGGKTVLRGGYGLYYGRITNGNILQVLFNTGSPKAQYTTNFKNNPNQSGFTQGPMLPSITGGGAITGKPSTYFFAPNLKLPEVSEYDLLIQQGFGRGTVFSVTYLGSLGRRLPNFLDMNINPSSLTAKTINVVDTTGKGPLPGSASPGTPITTNVYTAYGNTALLGANATNFQAVGEFISNVNSNYNAMVTEIQNHTWKTVTFDVNYTWSHALDYAQNVLTQGSTSGAWYDPYGNPRLNYGNSNFNTPNRFVAWTLLNLPNLHGTSPLKWVANDWSINDSFQMQNGLPYSAGMSGTISGAIASGWNGSGAGPAIIPGYVGVNTFKYPRRITDDLRVQKSVSFENSRTVRSVDLIANVFNVANHQNVTQLGTTQYSLSGSTLTYLGTAGGSFQQVTNSNSASFLLTPRQIEIAARVNF